MATGRFKKTHSSNTSGCLVTTGSNESSVSMLANSRRYVPAIMRDVSPVVATLIKEMWFWAPFGPEDQGLTRSHPRLAATIQ